MPFGVIEIPCQARVAATSESKFRIFSLIDNFPFCFHFKSSSGAGECFCRLQSESFFVLTRFVLLQNKVSAILDSTFLVSLLLLICLLRFFQSAIVSSASSLILLSSDIFSSWFLLQLDVRTFSGLQCLCFKVWLTCFSLRIQTWNYRLRQMLLQRCTVF